MEMLIKVTCPRVMCIHISYDYEQPPTAHGSEPVETWRDYMVDPRSRQLESTQIGKALSQQQLLPEHPLCQCWSSCWGQSAYKDRYVSLLNRQYSFWAQQPWLLPTPSESVILLLKPIHCISVNWDMYPRKIRVASLERGWSVWSKESARYGSFWT